VIARRPHNRRRFSGFTLIEASLALIIVGTGVLGMLQLFSSVSEQNMMNQRATTGMYLAQNINEVIAGVSFGDPDTALTTFGPEGEALDDFNDVDDFDNLAINPPIDALRQSIPELDRYTQRVEIDVVPWTDVSANPTGSENNTYRGFADYCMRVRVSVTYRERDGRETQVFQASTIRSKSS
jgi:type II secretory pathway pseudopilin PulG